MSFEKSADSNSCWKLSSISKGGIIPPRMASSPTKDKDTEHDSCFYYMTITHNQGSICEPHSHRNMAIVKKNGAALARANKR